MRRAGQPKATPFLRRGRAHIVHGSKQPVAVSLVRQERPDVVVIDVMMPRLDGLEATRRIKQEYPATKVLVLTSLTDDATRSEAFEKGADAFLDKREIATVLLPTIRLVTSLA